MPNPNIITSIDLTNPQHLIVLEKQAEEPPNFLLNRYFPCNPDTDIFPTEDVLIERNETSKRKAPFMKVGYRDSARDSYITERFEPARIATGRELTYDTLKKKGFGEAHYSDMTPEQRAAIYATKDLIELKRKIYRTLETMAAACLQDNGYTATYLDKDDAPEEIKLSFNEGAGVDTQYTPANMWDASSANILGDLKAMARMVRNNGCAATDVILGAAASDILVSNPEIQKLLDIRRYELGQIEPRLIAGYENTVSLVGLLTIDGIKLNLLQYSGTYEDDSKNLVPYIPENKVIVTAPNCGKSLFGAVSQVEQGDGNWHTYKGIFVPKYNWTSTPTSDSRQLMLACKPLLVPRVKNCWACATVTA